MPDPSAEESGRLVVRRVGGEHPCPYLPGRVATLVGASLMPGQRLSPAAHETLLARNFRRSGHVVYQPLCTECSACRSIRVPTAAFRPSRSQRRNWRRNSDLDVTIDAPWPSAEKHDIYARYLRDQHDGTMSDDPGAFEAFLYDSPTESREIIYRLDGRIVAVSLVDCVPGGMSSVYTYFDPADKRRGLGTYSALWEIDHCARMGWPYYYLGFYVGGCAKMSYKAAFRPNEILDPVLGWTAFRT